MLLGQETLATLLESGLYKCYHCTILLTKLNNQNFILPPSETQATTGVGRVIFLGVLDRLDPNPYRTQDNSLCTYSTFKSVGFHSCSQVGFLECVTFGFFFLCVTT